MQVYKINMHGFFVEDIILHQDDQVPKNCVRIRPKQGLYKPRYLNDVWIEGATQEEIDEMTKVEPSPSTDTEILGQQMTEREIESMFQGQQITDIELRVIMLEVQ